MPKLGLFLTNLATKYGISIADEPGFAELLQSTADIPDNVASRFETVEVLTETSARNNPKIKAHFFKEALDGADGVISQLLESHELAQEDRDRIRNERSTYERIKLLTSAVSQKEAQKVGASASEKQTLQQQINAINAEKAQLISQKDQEINTVKSSYEDRFKNLLINQHLASSKLDTTKIPKDVALTVARAVLDKYISEKGISVLNENETLKLKQAQDASLDYYENNQPLTFDSLVDRVLADNKLIAVTDPNSAAGENGNMRYNNRPIPPANPRVPGSPQPNVSMASSIDQALADFTRGNA